MDLRRPERREVPARMGCSTHESLKSVSGKPGTVHVSRQGKVSLRVYSVAGRLVRDLEGGVRDAGHYETLWDARDAEGRALPSGIYLSELRIDGRQVGWRKLLLLR
jgi:hypothetical protein